MCVFGGGGFVCNDGWGDFSKKRWCFSCGGAVSLYFFIINQVRSMCTVAVSK